MIVIRIILKITLLCIFISCNPTKSTAVFSSEEAKEASKIEVKLNKQKRELIRKKRKEEEQIALSQLNLDQYIYRMGNVQVKGEGADARIIIRGGKTTILSNTEPLFILNGIQIESFSQLFTMVEVENIKSLKVLKTASDAGFYGSRGSNGVIEIITE